MKVERRTIDLRRQRDYSGVEVIARWVEMGLIGAVLWVVFIGFWLG